MTEKIKEYALLEGITALVKKAEEKVIYDTWDGWCLRKLKELGRTTFKKWATAMNYKSPSSMKKIMERLMETGKLNITETEHLGDYICEVKEDVVFK